MKQQIITSKKKTTIKFPEDWKTYQLGDLGDFLKGKGISKKDRKDLGIPCILYGEIYTEHHYYVKKFVSFINNKTASKSIRLEKGDILFTGSGETKEEIGKPVAYLKDIEAYAGGDIIILRPKNMDSLFLSYLLNSEHQIKERARLAEGHSVVHIYPKELKSIKVHIPTLLEQRKIAEILSTWDKAIELKEKLVEQKKEQKKGLMQKLLTGEVRLPGFYEKWEKRQIGELITESKVIADEPDLNKRITVRLNLKGVQKREVTSVEKENVTTQYVRRAGQFIYGKQNLYKGAIGIVPEELDGFQSSSDIPSFDFNSDVDGLWFYYYFSRESFYSYLEVISTGTGSKRVNPKDLFRIKINVPPLDEQRQISKILLSQDQEIKLLEKELKALKMQKKGLMQLLLTGKIRVKV